MKDIMLLKSEAERCKEILLTLSKNPQNLKDNFFEKIKIVDLIKLNFDKFNDNKKIVINYENFDKDSQILFKDEINYALGNIIQNAILYSKSVIEINLILLEKEFVIKVLDDGNGFSKEVLDRVGEPYISLSKKGMGLGIFITKNLVENMKGSIIFRNSINNFAIVEIRLDRAILI